MKTTKYSTNGVKMNNREYLFSDYSVIREKNDKFSSPVRLREWLTIDALKAPDSTSSFTKGKAGIRKKLYKGENVAAKLIQCEYDSSHDWMTFSWLTPATMKAHGSDYVCKTTDPLNGFKTKVNPSELYTMQIRIIDFMKWLKQTRPESMNGQPITWREIKEVLQVAYVQVSCDDPSWWWQGDAWYGTQLDASIYPCNIPPKKWNKVHDPVNCLCKHLQNLIKSIDFFLNQMASMAGKELRTLNLI